MIRENPKVVGGARKTGKIHEIKSTWHMVLKDVGGEGGGVMGAKRRGRGLAKQNHFG